MELIIFLTLVGIGAIILLLWALITNKDVRNDKSHTMAQFK